MIPGDARGKRLPFAPRTTFNVGGDYRLDVGFGTLALNATYFRSASFFAAPDNVGRQGAYDLVNASATLTDPTSTVSVKLWAKNIGKTFYATSLVEANQGLVSSLGAPRTYGVTLGFRF